MMDYRPRPGIVQTKICDMTVLVPSRAAAKDCKRIMPLTFTGKIVWTGIEKDYPVKKIVEMYRLFSKKSDEELTASIEEFCQLLFREGFLIKK